MQSLLSSLARLADNSSLTALRDLFCAHGALGYGIPPGRHFSEIERLRIVPLIFGLLPTGALRRDDPNSAVKPAIRGHLQTLGVTPDELLLEVLKSVSDQYVDTQPGRPNSYRKKSGMADLRANITVYRQIIDRQMGRCAICGTAYKHMQSTLDHIIPYRLIGDIPDGANWRILCSACNQSKGNYLSSLQCFRAYNWEYGGDVKNLPLETPHSETRYVVLSQNPVCSVPGCLIGPLSAELSVEKKVPSGLAVADNLRVVCESHKQKLIAASRY